MWACRDILCHRNRILILRLDKNQPLSRQVTDDGDSLKNI
ncbi:hypothetical protein DDI_1371 [Dickeya dianthicola RNS04.9]|nr:hypothetical protein DDI_1371 [Dickeya dianthicola RNS04.9]